MTVRELIRELEKIPNQNKEVVVWDNESFCDDQYVKVFGYYETDDGMIALNF